MLKKTISKPSVSIEHKEIYSHDFGTEVIKIDHTNWESFFCTEAIKASEINKGEWGSQLISKFPAKLTHNIQYDINLSELKNSLNTSDIYVIYIADVQKAANIGQECKISINVANSNPNASSCPQYIIDIVDCGVPIEINFTAGNTFGCTRIRNSVDVVIKNLIILSDTQFGSVRIDNANVTLHSAELRDSYTFYLNNAHLVMTNTKMSNSLQLTLSPIERNSKESNVNVDDALYEYLMKDSSSVGELINLANSKIFQGFNIVPSTSCYKTNALIKGISNVQNAQTVFSPCNTWIKITDDLKQVLCTIISCSLNSIQNIGEITQVTIEEDSPHLITTCNHEPSYGIMEDMVCDCIVHSQLIQEVLGMPCIRQQLLVRWDRTGSCCQIFALPNTEIYSLLQLAQNNDDYKEMNITFCNCLLVTTTNEYSSRYGLHCGGLGNVHLLQCSNDYTGFNVVANSCGAINNDTSLPGYMDGTSCYKVSNTNTSNSDEKYVGFFIKPMKNQSTCKLQGKRKYLLCYELIIPALTAQEQTAELIYGIMKHNNGLHEIIDSPRTTLLNISTPKYVQTTFLLSTNAEDEYEFGLNSGDIGAFVYLNTNQKITMYLMDFQIYDISNIIDDNVKSDDVCKLLQQWMYDPYNRNINNYVIRNYFLDARPKPINSNPWGHVNLCPSKEMNYDANIYLNPNVNIVRPFFKVQKYSSGKSVIVDNQIELQQQSCNVGILPNFGEYKVPIVAFSEKERLLQQLWEDISCFDISQILLDDLFYQLPKHIQIFIKKNENIFNDLDAEENLYLVDIPYKSIYGILDECYAEDEHSKFQFQLIFDQPQNIHRYRVFYHEWSQTSWEIAELHNQAPQIWNNEENSAYWDISLTSYMKKNKETGRCLLYFTTTKNHTGKPEYIIYPTEPTIDGQSAFVMLATPNHKLQKPIFNLKTWEPRKENSPMFYQ